MNKNMVIIFFLLSSLNVMIFTTEVSPQGPTVVKVVPSLIEYYTDATGQQFTVAVKIEDVTNLYGFDIKFKWDTTFLEYVSHSVRVPKDEYPDGVLYKPIIDVTDQINTTGTYWLAKTSRWPAPSFNGSGTVFTMTFRVKKHPVKPQPTANLTLELYEVELAAIGGDIIPHIKQNGKIILHALEPSDRDVAITNIKPLKTVVGRGCKMNINVTVANQGGYAETFNVTLYANTTGIQIKTITLQSGTSATLTFTWNTFGFAKGNYRVWAYAGPILGETDIEDNTFTDGIVYVGIPGDLNADNIVDIFDAVVLAAAAGSTPGAPHWNPNADINNDFIVDIFDAVILAAHAGQTDP